MNRGEACGAMGSGRDGAGSGNAFLGKFYGNRNSAVLASTVGVIAEAQKSFHLGKID
jgi:hypothetical protein